MQESIQPSGILQQARRLRKAGQAEEALVLLKQHLDAGDLGAEHAEQAGRLVEKLFSLSPKPAQRVLLLGQCTLTWIKYALVASAFAQGIRLEVTEGEFDNVIQDLWLHAGQGFPFDLVLLFPWNNRLLDSQGQPRAERIDQSQALWSSAWALLQEHSPAKVIQVGYDWGCAGPLGYHAMRYGEGDARMVQDVNRHLCENLPAGIYYLNLEQISGMMGRSTFYDYRNYYWTKNPFSERGTFEVARHLAAAIRTLLQGTKKVLVLDLDNTLWGGIVGEAGPFGVVFDLTPEGEAYRAFQRYVQQLKERGVLLAIASKNNPEDAREPFLKRHDCILTLDDFAAFEAHWEPKYQSLRRIADALNLGLDSFVFFDDNPAEREQVRQMLPEVSVVAVPPDPADYVQALENGLYFETAEVTPDDRERSERYLHERKRKALAHNAASLGEYLTSLEMVGEVRSMRDEDYQRATQLMGKTNQFNLTTRRHAQGYLEKLAENPENLLLVFELRDRFGEYGVVGVALGVAESSRDPRRLEIDTFLLSCRVIGRTAEEFFMNALLRTAHARGYRQVVGTYQRTAKNGQVADLLPRLGFQPLSSREEGGDTYVFSLEGGSAEFATYVRPKE